MEVLILAVAAIVIVLFAMRQSVRAERREAETRRLIRKLYGGGE